MRYQMRHVGPIQPGSGRSFAPAGDREADKDRPPDEPAADRSPGSGWGQGVALTRSATRMSPRRPKWSRRPSPDSDGRVSAAVVLTFEPRLTGADQAPVVLDRVAEYTSIAPIVPGRSELNTISR